MTLMYVISEFRMVNPIGINYNRYTFCFFLLIFDNPIKIKLGYSYKHRQLNTYD